jgi:hypothetical protein
MKKSKPPKFVHVRLRDGRELVVHTANPIFFATVTHNQDGSTDINPFHFVTPIAEISNDVQKLAGLMRRMGDWYYYTVIKKEDYDADAD